MWDSEQTAAGGLGSQLSTQSLELPQTESFMMRLPCREATIFLTMLFDNSKTFIG